LAQNPCQITARFLDSYKTALEIRLAGKKGTSEVLTRLNAQNCSQSLTPNANFQNVSTCRYLATTLRTTYESNQPLADSIAALAPYLKWERMGPHIPRPPGPFMDDYAFTKIVGPNGVFPGDDFMMGFFMMGPDQYYHGHYHAAPEHYWLLSGPSEWQFSPDGPWEEQPAGTALWNRSFQFHATRTGAAPLLAIWAWTRDISGIYQIAGAGGASTLDKSAQSG